MWREMDEMRAELENMFRQNSAGGRLLPPVGLIDPVLPAIRGDFRVDVRDHGDDVIIVADLPGLEKENVTLQLLNPRALEISCGRREEREDSSEGYYVRERISGSMRRIVALPADVSEDNAKASFKNGVLEVTLKKTTLPQKSRIEIE
jgi:HSP20 family protein